MTSAQLESAYLREADSRRQAWKRSQDRIAEQTRHWPPPANGQMYNRREKAIYSVNEPEAFSDSWFQRRVYEYELMRAARRRVYSSTNRLASPW